jgi:ribonuclease E
VVEEVAVAAVPAAEVPAETAPAPTRRRRPTKAAAAAEPVPEPVTANGAEPAAEVMTEAAGEDESGSPRRGWWQRTFGA